MRVFKCQQTNAVSTGLLLLLLTMPCVSFAYQRSDANWASMTQAQRAAWYQRWNASHAHKAQTTTPAKPAATPPQKPATTQPVSPVMQASAPTAPTASTTPATSTAPVKSPASVVTPPISAHSTAAPIPARPAEVPATNKITKSAPATTPAVVETRPDIPGIASPEGDIPHTQDSPFAAVGSSWKMLAYLAPMLFLIVGGLRLLQNFQKRNGRLPGLLQTASSRGGPLKLSSPAGSTPRSGIMNALLGGFHLNNARQQAGSNIKIIESVPLGGANLHLIEVRGRKLLIGATSGGLNVLTEFREQELSEGESFHSLLHAAAADLDSLELSETDVPAAAVVGSLEEVMRDTRDTLSRRVRRLRTVQEEEDACLSEE